MLVLLCECMYAREGVDDILRFTGRPVGTVILFAYFNPSWPLEARHVGKFQGSPADAAVVRYQSS